MNILYISHMGADIAAGLTWSVPASITAQKQYDNVCWVNHSNATMEHWNDTGVYHCLNEFGPKLKLEILPPPFDKPDVVVFEGFYSVKEVVFSWELRRRGIPYVVIPRGSLTKQAFHNHSWQNCLKKKIACFFLFRPFTRHALAVQFLTKRELQDSGNSWTKTSWIISNGITAPARKKDTFSSDGIKMVFIGRPTIYQKGLDLLIDACVRMKEELMSSHVTIAVHCPQKNDYNQLISSVESADINEVLELKGAVWGKEKENVLLQSDVFIMMSRFEGHPMGLIEALSYGLPVVVTPGTNMSEEIKGANAGWVSDSGSDSLCQTFRQVIAEKHLFKVKGKNAHTLSGQFEWNALAQELHRKLEHSIMKQ